MGYSALQFIPMMWSSEATIVAGNSTWEEKDDPVMGGGSKGAVFSLNDPAFGSFITWQGAVKNVSFLNAPGFCSIQTTSLSTQDAHAFIAGGLVLKVRSSTPGYRGFKVKFAAPSIPVHHGYHGRGYGSQAQGFHVPASKGAEFQTVFLPFNGFSYDWSDFTGDCSTKDPDGFQHQCCSQNASICPTVKQLTGLDSVMIYAEGVEGKFHLDVQEIKATDCAHMKGMSHSHKALEFSANALVV